MTEVDQPARRDVEGGYIDTATNTFYRTPQAERLTIQRPGEGDVWHRFNTFRQNNPKTHRHIITRVLECVAAGDKRGMKGVFEDVRHLSETSGDNSGFALNNVLTALYARWCMRELIAPDGWFEMRESAADGGQP